MGSAPVRLTQVAVSTPFDNSTNGFTANNVQAAIEEASFQLVDLEVTATANITTVLATDVVMTTMTIIPGAGKYLCIFSTAIQTTAAGSTCTVTMYNNGVAIADTARQIAPFDGGTLSAATGKGAVAINKLVTVLAGQAVDIRWNVTSGTATAGPRTFNLLKVG